MLYFIFVVMSTSDSGTDWEVGAKTCQLIESNWRVFRSQNYVTASNCGTTNMEQHKKACFTRSQSETDQPNITSVLACKSRLLKSHMRLKKNRPYYHWLKSQRYYLLCFSTSSGRSQFGSFATRDYKPCYSLKATTRIPPL